MAYTVEGLIKIDGYNDNVRVGFKEGGYSVEQVNECDSSRSCRLKSELVGEDQGGGWSA